MEIVIIISIIALLFTWTESHANFKYGMLCGFFLITLLGCIHYMYGNDYLEYMNIFKTIGTYRKGILGFFDGTLSEESGWLLVNYIFQPFGFFTLVAAHSIVVNTFYYRFIRTNVSKEYWTLSVFIYLFTANLYLLHFSMLRQSLAMAICLMSWSFIRNRRVFTAISIVLLASLFHKSACIFLPFVILGYFHFEKGWKIGVLIMIVILLIYVSVEYFVDFFLFLSDFEILEDYVRYGRQEMKEVSYGLGFILRIIPLFIFVYTLTRNVLNNTQKQLGLVACVSYFFIPFSFIIPMINRIGFYFEAYSVAGIPVIYSSINNVVIRRSMICFYVLFVLYQYNLFFTNDIWTPYYSNFRTIFETWF